MLSEAYGGEAMKISTVFECCKWLKEGHENMEDDEDNSHYFRYQEYCSF
jgi:hypothetical protein